MKYRCDMVKDLMPLCLDQAASASSEQTVIEHLAECKECSKYYESLGKEMEPIEEQRNQENKYIKLASKMRRRKRIINLILGFFLGVFLYDCLYFISDYRSSSRAAAELGEPDASQVIACYEWKDDYHFYIYDSYNCYNIIGVERLLLGWKKHDDLLNSPKWSVYDENIGIETAGELCHFRYDEGVQLFPVRIYDENVRQIEVTCYKQTQKKEVTPGEVVLFTFDAVGYSNEIEATAYDAMGNAIYRLGENYIWVPVE